MPDSEKPAETRDLRQEIQAELEATRRSYQALLSAFDPGWLDRPSANPAWTQRETLFHLSMALRFLPSDISLLRRIRRVPRPPAFIFHRFNEIYTRFGARHKDLPALGGAYDEAHRDVLELLGTVTPGEWQIGTQYPDWDPLLSGFVTFERLFRYPRLHFEAHRPDLVSLRNGDSE